MPVRSGATLVRFRPDDGAAGRRQRCPDPGGIRFRRWMTRGSGRAVEKNDVPQINRLFSGPESLVCGVGIHDELAGHALGVIFVQVDQSRRLPGLPGKGCPPPAVLMMSDISCPPCLAKPCRGAEAEWHAIGPPSIEMPMIRNFFGEPYAGASWTEVGTMARRASVRHRGR